MNLFKKYINEANIEKNNPVNINGKIDFSATTGGIEIQAQNNNSGFDIIMYSDQQSGNGNYIFESPIEKNEIQQVYNNLLKDIKGLMDNFDKDLKSVLNRYGLVEKK